MTDNLKIRQPLDPKKINIHEQWEVNEWTKKWNITAQQLIDAVKKVGVLVVDVARYLGKPV